MTGPVYRRPPGDVLAAVEIVLRDLGLTRLYRCVDPRIGVGVLSVAWGVTAWCDGRTVEWWHGGEDARWPAADPGGAAQQLARLVRVGL